MEEDADQEVAEVHNVVVFVRPPTDTDAYAPNVSFKPTLKLMFPALDMGINSRAWTSIVAPRIIQLLNETAEISNFSKQKSEVFVFLKLPGDEWTDEENLIIMNNFDFSTNVVMSKKTPSNSELRRVRYPNSFILNAWFRPKIFKKRQRPSQIMCSQPIESVNENDENNEDAAEEAAANGAGGDVLAAAHEDSEASNINDAGSEEKNAEDEEIQQQNQPKRARKEKSKSEKTLASLKNAKDMNEFSTVMKENVSVSLMNKGILLQFLAEVAWNDVKYIDITSSICPKCLKIQQAGRMFSLDALKRHLASCDKDGVYWKRFEMLKDGVKESDQSLPALPDSHGSFPQEITNRFLQSLPTDVLGMSICELQLFHEMDEDLQVRFRQQIESQPDEADGTT